jgi:hypothetical protein
MASLWDPGDIFRPLDMSEIPGYPRQIPPECNPKKFPMFFGDDDTTTKEHMSNFWALFQLNFIDDEVEDVVMKLFSPTLFNIAKEWYDGLHDKGIKTMEQFEDVLLEKWGIRKDPKTLFQRPIHIKKEEICEEGYHPLREEQ